MIKSISKRILAITSMIFLLEIALLTLVEITNRELIIVIMVSIMWWTALIWTAQLVDFDKIENKRIDNNNEALYAVMWMLNNESREVDDQFSLMKNELGQVKGIVTDANQKIFNAFIDFQEQTDQRHRMMLALAEKPGLIYEQLEFYQKKEEKLTQQMESTVNEIIKLLQFDDMTTQLTTHISNRINMLSEFRAQTGKLLKDIEYTKCTIKENEWDCGVITKKYSHLVNSLIKGTEHNPVTVKKMEEQDIELF